MAVRLQYSFDEASGNFLENGGGPAGSLTGVGSRTTGHTGNALTSSSGAPGGTVTGSPVIASGAWTAVTVMAWIQRGTAAGDCLVMWDGAGDMVGVKLGSSGANAGGWIRTNSNVNELVPAHGAGGTGTWIHVAIVWAAADNTLRIFINGSQVTSGGLTGATLFGNISTIEVMGSNVLSWNSGPSAPIDDVRLFDSAESGASITTWMNTPVGGSGSSSKSFPFRRNRSRGLIMRGKR